MKKLLTLALIFAVRFSVAQTAIDVNRVGANDYGSITIYGVNGDRNMIPYSNITGSAFYNEDWLDASLYDSNNRLMGKYKSKMNLATHEVYYLKNDQPVAADKGLVSKIIFTNTDGSQTIFATGLPYIFDDRDRGKYAQIFNTGTYQLAKVTTQEVAVGDSLFGTMKRYYFKTTERYYLQHGQETYHLKKLNKENLLSYLPGSQNLEAWIKEQRLNMKKESDAARFIEYYNSTVR